MIQALQLSPEDPDFLAALNRRLAALSEAIEARSGHAASSPGAAAAQASLNGTHKQRLALSATKVEAGTTYWETDRRSLYVAEQVGQARRWRYAAGHMRGLLSPDEKPTDLGVYDLGFLFYARDFRHTYRWDGANWYYAAELGDPGSGQIEWWTVGPNNNGLYQLCDGSTVTRSLNTGGLASVTVPNLIGAYAKGAAAYTGTRHNATNGSLSGAMSSAGSHGHSIPTFLTDSNGAGATVQSGSGANVAALNHQHWVSSNPSTGAAGDHTHDLAGVSVTGGEPARVELLPYMRL